MSEQHQPLWSDSRIIQALSDGGFDHDNWLIAKLTMEVIRDEYEAELAAVRGQLARCSELYDKRKGEMWQLEQDLDALAAEVERLRAGSYQPVPDGIEYYESRGLAYSVFNDGSAFAVGTEQGGGHFSWPDGVRLCQWQPAQDTQQPSIDSVFDALSKDLFGLPGVGQEGGE